MSGLGLATYLIVVVYALNFLALSAVAARQAGQSVWLFGKKAGDRHISGVLLRAAFGVSILWPAVRVGLIWLGCADPAILALDSGLLAVVGHFLVAGSAMIATLSQYHMGTSWRVGAAAGAVGPLVDTGPFAISRNPVFLGQGLLLVGLVLAFPDLLQLAAALIALVTIVLQVRREEAVLRATLGPDYEAYAQRVPRWLGRPRKS